MGRPTGALPSSSPGQRGAKASRGRWACATAETHLPSESLARSRLGEVVAHPGEHVLAIVCNVLGESTLPAVRHQPGVLVLLPMRSSRRGNRPVCFHAGF